MRVEDIVGVSFFGLLISGIVVAISGSRTKFTPRQRALWRGWGLGLIGGAVFAFGLVNYQLIHKSPRLVVEGNLWDIRDRFGSRTEMNQFMITDATGHAVLIRCRYSGPGLVQGERARVRYVAYNRKLVEMNMKHLCLASFGFETALVSRGWRVEIVWALREVLMLLVVPANREMAVFDGDR